MTPRQRLLITLSCIAVVCSHQPMGAEEDPGLYVQRLNQTGNSDIAIEFLSRRLQKPGITDTERSEIELAIAESYLASTAQFDQARQRDERLQLAREKFTAWIAANPLASPSITADARSFVAEIDFLRGRLYVVLAHFPDNQSTVNQLADKAREFLLQGFDESVAVSSIYLTEYEKMPAFIPEDQKENHELKSGLYGRYAAARFRAALAKFYRADSFRTIEYPPPAPQTDPALVTQFQNEQLQRAEEYRIGIDRALAAFDGTYREHRQEMVGIYCQMWTGRCESAQGNFRKALGMYEQIFAHDTPHVPRALRQLVYFRFVAFTEQKEYRQVIVYAEQWLRDNPKPLNEESYQGIQYELAIAHLHIANVPTASAEEKTRSEQRAAALLAILAKTYNPFQGLAVRAQNQLKN